MCVCGNTVTVSLLPRTYGDDAVKEGLKYLLLFNHMSRTGKGGLKAIFTEALLQSQVR